MMTANGHWWNPKDGIARHVNSTFLAVIKLTVWKLVSVSGRHQRIEAQFVQVITLEILVYRRLQNPHNY